jgi:hypothetical protein
VARASSPKPRAPRLLPPPYKLGEEPDWTQPSSQVDQETLGSLVYLSVATPFNGADSNTATATFINSLNNSVYSQLMNVAFSQ